MHIQYDFPRALARARAGLWGFKGIGARAPRADITIPRAQEIRSAS